MRESDKCRQCRGKKVAKERKVLELHIEQGMKNGQKVTFSGEADEAPGTVAGDVVFVLQEKPHEIFKRHRNDLIMEKKISLVEALCGFSFLLEHMDGRQLKISSNPGEIINPEAIKMIPNEGMPLPNTGGLQKGRLFIKFTIQFPEEGELSADQLASLEATLPGRPVNDFTGEEEDCELMDVDPSSMGEGGPGDSANAYDSDDERGGGGHGQRVQCQNCIM